MPNLRPLSCLICLCNLSYVVLIKVFERDGDHSTVEQLSGDTLVVLSESGSGHHSTLPDRTASVR